MVQACKHVPRQYFHNSDFLLTYYFKVLQFSSVHFTSVTQSHLTLCNHMNPSTPGLPITNSQNLHKLKSIEWVMPFSHLILCCPLLFLSAIPPSIRVFPNESTLPMRWPKYWSFSFSITPSNEHPGLISFRMDWLDLLAECAYIHINMYVCVHKISKGLCIVSIIDLFQTWRRKWQPTPVFLPGESHGQRNLAGYGP